VGHIEKYTPKYDLTSASRQ